MLSKFQLLLITTSTFLIAIQTCFVNAGSPLSRYSPADIDNEDWKEFHTSTDHDSSVRNWDFYWKTRLTSDAVEAIKNTHRAKSTLNRSPGSDESSNLQNTFTKMYGKYNRHLGSGLFGTVQLYNKVDELNPKKIKLYSVKKYHGSNWFMPTSQYENLILNEFEIGYTLRHENIVQIYDLLQNEKDEWCLVMEFLNGTSLLWPNYENSFPRSHIFVQLIHGISFLHSKGIAHKEIKPNNLMLTTDNVLKIIDFGSSITVKSVTESPSRNPIEGTLSTLAPEILSSAASDVSLFFSGFFHLEYNLFAADVYACGVTYYYILFGQLPWSKAREDNKDFKAYKEDPQKWFSQKETRNDNPIIVPHVVQRMMDPNPETRIKLHEIKKDAWFIEAEQSYMEAKKKLAELNE